MPPSPSLPPSISNPSPLPLPGPTLLHHLISPPSSSPALTSLLSTSTSETLTLTYADLHILTSALAAHLLSLLPPSTPINPIIPILLPQSPDLYIAQIAILKAGAAFCPLTLDTPPDRLLFILSDISAPLLITGAAPPGIPLPIPTLPITLPFLCSLPKPPRLPSLCIPPSHLAYLLYTSGSTGLPKAVGVPHLSATQSLLAHNPHIPPFTRFLQFASPTFDVSVFEIFFPLLRGRTLVSAPRAILLDDLPGTINRLSVDACELTPSVAGSLLGPRDKTPSLRCLLTIGEMLTERVIREFGGDETKESMLWGMYGPTEAAIHCTVAPAMSSTASPNSIGIPLATVSCYIISEEDPGVVLPVGTPGELAVGGHQLATGYVNRPEQTAAAFIETEHGRLYRTGDRAVMSADGSMKCLGRISEGQIKLRGQRMELGEVEQAVLRYEACHSAMAAVAESVLVVFCAVTIDIDRAAAEEGIREVCKRWLPGYMIPGAVVIREAFPRLPSGKIDRKTLKREYEESLLDNQGDKVEQPEDNADIKKVIEIVESVVPGKVKASTLISSAGLDSLAAIRLAATFRSAGVPTHALDILAAKTIADLTSLLSVSPSGPPAAPTTITPSSLPLSVLPDSIPASSVEAVAPCSAIQTAMITETLRDPVAYCNRVDISFGPSVSPEQALSAWHDLASQSPILRTGFVVAGDVSVQVIFTSAPPNTSIVEKPDALFSLETPESFLTPWYLQIISPSEPPADLQATLFIHHAIYDGWSLEMLFSDLSDLLTVSPSESEPPPSRRPAYHEISGLLVNEMTPGQQAAARSFWSRELANFDPLPFPQVTAKIHRKSLDILQRSRTLTIPKDTLLATATSLSCAPQTLFQLSIASVLSQISATSNITLGTVLSGRTRNLPSIESVLGPFLTSLPLPISLSSDIPISSVARHVHGLERRIMGLIGMPLKTVHETLGVPPGTKLWSVLVAYQARMTPERTVREIGSVDYLENDVLVQVHPGDDRFTVSVMARDNAMDAEFADVFLGHIESVLQLLIEAPDTPCARIPVAMSSSRLSVFNPDYTPLSRPANVALAFEDTASAYPEHPALLFLESLSPSSKITRVSFAALNSHANQIAYLLKILLPTSGTVAIIMEKSPLLYAGILGIVKAGHAYLPLLPSTPADRVSTIMAHASVGLCLVDAAGLPLASAIPTQFVNLSTANLSFLSTANPDHCIDPSAPAYIIYTSGTTGTPKGIVATHLNLLGNIDVLTTLYPSAPRHSRLLQACSQAFDVSVFEIFWTWLNGLTLCTGTKGTLFSDLPGAIARLSVTHLSMTPTVASLLTKDSVPTVHFLVTAGEPMTEALRTEWGPTLFQGYGPSETTNICTVKQMVDPSDHIGHLGFAFRNTSAFVMPPDSLDPLPIGATGELVFGGDQVTAGYLNALELTAAKYPTHPAFGRLYRSGDLGRMLPDGTLVILGRIDDQVKIRGQRVDVGEINGILTASIASAAVTLKIQERLVSFYVGDTSESARRKAFGVLRGKVPRYMVPAFLIGVSEIPLTASGKVDNRNLTALFESFLSEELASFGAPSDEIMASSWSPSERLVADALSVVLGLDEEALQPWTPLVTIGLDSFISIKIARVLSERLAREISVAGLLRSSTISQLAETIFGSQSTESGINELKEDQKPLVSPEITRKVSALLTQKSLSFLSILPTTPLQTSMLALDPAIYICKLALRIPDDDPEVFTHSWLSLCRHHGILRTAFVETGDDNMPFVQVQLVDTEPTYVSRIATSSVDAYLDELSGMIPGLLADHRPPVRMGIAQERGSYFACIAIHHSLYDGIAMKLLLSNLAAIHRHGRSPIPDGDYAAFLSEALEIPSDAPAFWKKLFNSFTPKRLPRTAGTKGYKYVSTPVSVSSAAVNSLVKRHGVSLLSTIQAIWTYIISAAFDTPDIAIGNVISGRHIAIVNIDTLAAPCFNTVPLRADTSSAISTLLDLVFHFQELNEAIRPYSFSALRDVQRHVGKGRLFDSLVILQPAATDTSEWEVVRDDSAMNVPIVCEVHVGNKVELTVHHDCSFITSDVARKFAPAFEYMLQMLLTAPKSQLERLKENPALSHLISSSPKALSSTIPPTSLPLSIPILWAPLQTTVLNTILPHTSTPASKITPTTPFSHLSLDSINSFQIAASLRSTGFQISGVDVLENPTCAGIAEFLERQQNKSDASTDSKSDDAFFTPATDEIEEEEPMTVDCTAVQDAMIVESIKTKGSAYVNHFVLELTKDFAISHLKDSLAALVTVHPILRTGFFHADGDTNTSSAYKMIIYEAYGPTITETESLDMDSWFSSSRNGIMADLSLPPWRAIIYTSRLSIAFSIHHALYDATSLSIILASFSRILSGHTVPHHSVVSAFRHLHSLTSSSAAASKRYWEIIGKTLVINAFPIMTPLTPPIRESRSVSTTLSLTSDNLSVFLKTGISTQALVHAIWTRILAAYLGTPSVTFGTVLSGRDADGLDNIAIPCVTTLPVTGVDVESNAELLKMSMKNAIEVMRHQFTRPVDIPKWTGNPGVRLFDTIVVLQRETASEGPWVVTHDKGTVNYPVSVEVIVGKQLRLNLTFWTDILPVEQAEILSRQFDLILCDLTRNSIGIYENLWRTSPSVMSIMPPKQPTLPTPHTLLHHLVEQTVRDHPDSLALEFVNYISESYYTSKTWTFKELDNMANHIAKMLIPLTKPDDVVVVHYDKCPEAYPAMLGILKAGCAYLALDPSAPADRKSFILSDSKATVLLQTAHLPKIEYDIKTITLSIDELGQHKTINKPADRATPKTRSYCLYTSGTTGTPKGCELTHDNAVQGILAFTHLLAPTVKFTSRLLQFASFHFDVSVLEQYWPWSIGIPVVSALKDAILSDIENTLSVLDISHVDLTPSLAALVRPEKVPSLCDGLFITGGEQLRHEILDAWGDHQVIHNAYGPTEATIGVTMRRRVPRNGRPANIGTPFPNVGAYVFEPGTEIPVLRGAVGELCVSGPLIGKGYLGRPDLTAEKFPTLKYFKDRVYRTGDLVRVLHDNSFDFLGRADDQVKLRGQRLELGEINHAIISGVPGIHHAVSLVVKHRVTGKDLLVSFIATSAMALSFALISPEVIEPKLSSKAISACRGKLPGYMVPTYVLETTYIPLNANNKADTKALRGIFNALSPGYLMNIGKSVSSEPASEGEAKIIEVLKKFSGIGDVNGSTNIFDCGIDSISITSFVRLLKSRNINVSVATVLQYPTARELATKLREPKSVTTETISDTALTAFAHSVRAEVSRRLTRYSEIEYILPCSPLQEGMLSRASMSEDGVYFNHFLFNIRKDDLHNIVTAWKRLIEELPILRTVFVPTGKGFAQVALKRKECIYQTSVDNNNLKEAVSKLSAGWVKENKAILETPLKITVLRTKTSSHLLVQMFHALYDGTSIDLLLSLVAKYAEKHDAPAPLTPSFAQVLPHLLHLVTTDFWKNHLSTWTPTAFPAVKILNPGTKPSVHRLSLSLNQLEPLRYSLSTPWSVLSLILFLNLVSPIFPASFTTGVITSGRTFDIFNVTDTIGPLLNTIPFHISQDTPTWRVIAKKVTEFFGILPQIEHTSLRTIQKSCEQARGKALFDSLFSFRKIEKATWNDLMELIDDDVVADYPVSCEMELSKEENSLSILLIVKPEVAAAVDFKALFGHLKKTLESVTPETLFTNGVSTNTPTLTLPIRNTTTSAEVSLSPTALILRTELSRFSGVAINDINHATTITSLGLDSIDIVRLSAGLRDLSPPLIISPMVIMKAQTLAEISTSIDKFSTVEKTDTSSIWTETINTLTKAVKSSHPDIVTKSVLPATPLQETMVAKMLESDFEWYFNQDLRKVASSVDVKRLEQAITDVINANPILHGAFVPITNASVSATFSLVVTDQHWAVQHVSIDDISKAQSVMATARAQAKRSGGLADLFQVHFIHVNESVYVLLSIAHALYDGFSLDMVHNDFIAAYHGSVSTHAGPEGFLSFLISTSPDSASSFWSHYLSSATPSLIPAVPTSNFSPIHKELTSTLSPADVRSLSTAHSLSLQSIVFSAYAALLASIIASPDVTFGAVLSNRDLPGAADIMFPTMNTVAIRSIIHGSGLEFMRYMQKNHDEMREFQTYPLRLATAKSGTSGLFNTLFIVQKVGGESVHEPLLLESAETSADLEYPLAIDIKVSTTQITWRMTASPSVYCANILSSLDTVFQTLVNNPETPMISDAKILSLLPFSPPPATDSSVSNGILTPASDSDPWSPLELTIRSILSKLSGVLEDEIPRSSTLYRLGLDSITAIKVSAALKKQGVKLTPRQLITAVDIREMAITAALVHEMSGSEQKKSSASSWNPNILKISSGLGVSLGEIEDVLPCIPMQTYMLSAWDMTNGAIFSPEFAWDITGMTMADQDIITNAWAQTVDSYPILRTVFVPSDSINDTPFLQVILKPTSNLVTPVKSLPLTPAFFTPTTPFVRPSLASSSGNSVTFALAIHHALYDASSLSSLIRHFKSFISALKSGSTLPGPIPLAPWREMALAPRGNEQERKVFWQTKLSGRGGEIHQQPERPEDREMCYQEGALPEDAIEKLRRGCSERNVSMQAVLFACVAKVIALKKKVGDVVLGVYMGVSTDADTLDAAFPTLNLLPILVKDTQGDFWSMVTEVQKSLHDLQNGRARYSSLYEISQWTGAFPVAFVNFLISLPTSEPTPDRAIICLRDMPPRGSLGWTREVSSTLGIRNAWCKETIDIELAISAGKLDMGVFGAREVVRGAEEMLQAIAEAMMLDSHVP